MGTSLRTRLFVIVGTILAASIGASTLLTRRATLVEVRDVEARTASSPHLDEVARVLEGRLAEKGLGAIPAAVADAGRGLGLPLVLLEPHTDRVLAAWPPEFAGAVVRRGAAPGHIDIEVSSQGQMSRIAMRGAPLRSIALDGAPVGALLVLPAADDGIGAVERLAVFPSWLLASVATVAIALALTFTLSRRVLRPVSALTDAARRMQQGDLGARVPVPAPVGDEIGDLARAFNAMAEQVAQNERIRRQMVSDVAHELRSPVTNLRCTLEALQDGLAPLDRAAVDALHEEAVFLQTLIADLQDLALAEAGRLTLHLTDTDLGALASRVAAKVDPAGTRIRVQADPGLPLAAADPARIEQVLRNLLSNALRHTPAEAEIVVRVGRAKDGISLEVADRGSGIAAEHLPYVFDRFYRADDSRSRATGGTGLGLAIVRHLVSAHRGSVTVESGGTGQGAVFRVTLPALTTGNS